jgi:hypothetical protein
MDALTSKILEDHMLADIMTMRISQKAFRKQKKVLTARVMGTTFSGHAVATTLGNSLRVAAMMSYIFHLCGYDGVMFDKNDNVRLLVAGDDVYIRCTEEAEKKFLSIFYKFYATSTETPVVHGFG